MRRFFLLLLSGFVIHAARGSEQEGYILQLNGDTVKGTVEAEIKKQLFGKAQLSLGEMEQSVSFKEGTGKFRKYRAGEISGYGFLYGNSWYHFILLDMTVNTWKKSEGGDPHKINNQKIFLQRVLDGALPLYKNYYRVEMKTLSLNSGSTSKTVEEKDDLYIRTRDMGFVEVAPARAGDNKKFREFLMKYLSLEEDFLKTVDDKAKFSDAETIIRSYNDWKKNN